MIWNTKNAEFWLRCLDMAYRYNLGRVSVNGAPDMSFAGRADVADQIYDRAVKGPLAKPEGKSANE